MLHYFRSITRLVLVCCVLFAFSATGTLSVNAARFVEVNSINSAGNAVVAGPVLKVRERDVLSARVRSTDGVAFVRVKLVFNSLVVNPDIRDFLNINTFRSEINEDNEAVEIWTGNLSVPLPVRGSRKKVPRAISFKIPIDFNGQQSVNYNIYCVDAFGNTVAKFELPTITARNIVPNLLPLSSDVVELPSTGRELTDDQQAIVDMVKEAIFQDPTLLIKSSSVPGITTNPRNPGSYVLAIPNRKQIVRDVKHKRGTTIIQGSGTGGFGGVILGIGTLTDRAAFDGSDAGVGFFINDPVNGSELSVKQDGFGNWLSIPFGIGPQGPPGPPGPPGPAGTAGSSGPPGVTVLAACQDGNDNDADGLTDFPADPGCTNQFDNNETDPVTACNDGIDNDSDGVTDFPADIGCTSLGDNNEQNPACSDGVDNDGDTLIDFNAGGGGDPGCTTLLDNNETDPAVPPPPPSPPSTFTFFETLNLTNDPGQPVVSSAQNTNNINGITTTVLTDLRISNSTTTQEVFMTVNGNLLETFAYTGTPAVNLNLGVDGINQASALQTTQGYRVWIENLGGGDFRLRVQSTPKGGFLFNQELTVRFQGNII